MNGGFVYFDSDRSLDEFLEELESEDEGMDTVGNSASTLYQQISFSAVSVGAERNRRISNYHRIT